MLCPGSQVGLRLTLALFGMVVMVTALPIMLPSFLFNVLTAVIFLNVLSGKKNPNLFPKTWYDSDYELMSVVVGSLHISVALSLSHGLIW